MPSLAQGGAGPAPENRQDGRYGPGQDCDQGYRIADGTCVALNLAANATPTGRSYGTGWACLHGCREVRGATCEAAAIPANAFLDATGLGWNCDRGYNACALIDVTENGYLTDCGISARWECDRGHVALAGTCVPIVIPENDCATNAGYGAAWRCERGLVQAGGRCEPVAVPANAFLDDRSHGPGWRCARGFQTRQAACIAIDLPESAHLDRSGNRRQCNRGFQLSEGNRCILTR
ncbi:MAG: hypothetical protein ACXIU8_05565 [Alkalilacustris sp.]